MSDAASIMLGATESALPGRLRALVRPGDAIIWGQGTGEPTAITAALVNDRNVLRPGPIFVGATFSRTLNPEICRDLKVTSYGTLGETRLLADAGLLDILPGHISRLGYSITRGEIACDVAIVQLSRPGPNGRASLGVINDYIRAAIVKARVVIAEVNDQLPWTYGPEPIGLDRITYSIDTSHPLAAVDARPPSDIERRIGKNVASLIRDGATLQVGIGGTIDALLQALEDRRDLGVHSGAISDAVLDLIERGVITNGRKPIDRGVTITGALFGGERLFRFADRNPLIQVHPYEYTHGAGTLALVDNLVTVNSAVEVDLTGQANAEIAGGRYIGAVGGQVDFMHAGTRAREGCSIIALPSTAAGGNFSRIQPHVQTVTCPRSEIDFVVTEHGCADLRGRSIRQRVHQMISVAHPEFQEQLERDAFEILRRGF